MTAVELIFNPTEARIVAKIKTYSRLPLKTISLSTALWITSKVWHQAVC